jgi:uncharacterized protein (TIGR04222 family)
MTKRLLASFSILVLLLSVASVAFAAKTYRAERFDADWQVSGDGSLTIAETVVFAFSGGPFTYVYRELPDSYSDGIEVLAVSMDGQPLTQGAGTGQYEVENGGEKKVTWHFAPTSDATHTFGLTYRALGAVRRQGGQDLLVWNFLPTDYEYPIDAATLRLSYPASAQRVGAPEVRRGQATVSEADGQAVFTAANIRKGSPLTVALRFAEGSLIAEQPAWQQHAAMIAQRAPTMWLLAALVLSLGTVGLAWGWRAGARPGGARPVSRALVRTAPPSNLSPALAGALVNYNGKAGMVQAMATLFGLAQRGVVTFEETGEQKWYRGPQFAVRLQAAALTGVRLDPPEEALIAALFTGKGRAEVPVAKLGEALRKAMRSFGKTIEAQLVERSLLDPARAAHARRLVAIGILLLVLILPLLAVAVFFWRDFGGWVLLVPIASFILSMAAFVLSGLYSVRSDEGEEEAADWRSFRDYIKGVAKGREPAWDMHVFDRYFPYAATFDLAEGWAKAFRERGGAEVPVWFRSLSTADGDRLGAFIVMTSALHSSTASSGGGAGAGGAGGGGGSGAG